VRRLTGPHIDEASSTTHFDESVAWEELLVELSPFLSLSAGGDATFVRSYLVVEVLPLQSPGAGYDNPSKQSKVSALTTCFVESIFDRNDIGRASFMSFLIFGTWVSSAPRGEGLLMLCRVLTPLKAMGKRVSMCLRHGEYRSNCQLSLYRTLLCRMLKHLTQIHVATKWFESAFCPSVYLPLEPCI
jgi:hypothetical protein